MNFPSFLRLLYEIYFAQKPDLDHIRRLGLLATKIGQLYALRADFIGVERASILAQLYEQNFDTRAIQNTKTRFDEELRKNFASIEENPFSEASIGKVYAAKLLDSTPVVVKMIKDDFRAPFMRDVAKLKRYFRVIIFFYPKLAKVADPIGTLEDLERMTLSELNLENEIL